MDREEKNIVIIGGGIIGATSAYYLTRHPSYNRTKHHVTLLEASTIAGGASGKAGGLLALWAYPSQIVPLSFHLHAELAAEHGGEKRWGYRRIGCGQLQARGRAVGSENRSAENGGKAEVKNGNDAANANANGNGNGDSSVSLKKRDPAALKRLRSKGFPDDLDWIASESARAYESMGSPDDTAQVHPYHFTLAIADLAREAGVRIVEHARVTSVNRVPDGDGSGREKVESVTYEHTTTNPQKQTTTETIPASQVVLSAGPWTSRIIPSLKLPISALRAHSVTIQAARDATISPYALFTEISLPPNFPGSSRKSVVSPEIYARPSDEVYACGEGDTLVPLPDTTRDVETDMARCEDIVRYVGSVSEQLRGGEVTARQACYLPVSSGGSGWGGPWIGEVRGCRGVVVASGHSCWGIQNGPGTGKCVSEVLLDGKVKSAQLGPLDPARSL
ncbi:MAG: hypothetical protein M1831_002048 [Alyxoria varia]|nr:MAG: hypothetical protein M1831_002048 [Alyxoria varia]